jgi:hypothetical protein
MLGVVACVLLVPALGAAAQGVENAAPLVIGETFAVDSKVLGETRRVNVYLPPGYAESTTARLPVLYMPDGGLAEELPARGGSRAGVCRQRDDAPVNTRRHREY